MSLLCTLPGNVVILDTQWMEGGEEEKRGRERIRIQSERTELSTFLLVKKKAPKIVHSQVFNTWKK